MRSVIWSDDKIDMHRHIRFAIDPCFQYVFVEPVGRKINDRISDASNDRRNDDFLFLFLFLDFWLVRELFGFIDSLDCCQQFADRLDLI